MRTEWWISRNGKKFGPVSSQQLKQLATSGKLQRSDLVWKDGTTNRVPAGTVKGLFQAASPQAASESPPDPLLPPRPRPATAAARPREHTRAVSNLPADESSAAHTVVMPSPSPASAGNAPGLFSVLINGAGITGTVGGIFGFVGDVLSPLGPINAWLAGTAGVGCLMFGFFSWRRKRAGAFNPQRLLPERSFIFSLFLLLAFGLWSVLGRLAGEEDQGVLASNIEAIKKLQTSILDLKRDVAAVKQDTEAIRDDTSQIKQTSKQTKDTIAQVDAKLDQLSLAIREGIGATNLGPRYENTAFHREYQDKYIEQGGRRSSLIVEYQQRVRGAPDNAMFHYLLARAYDTNEQPKQARKTALAGYQADKSYSWIRRYLLYFSLADPFDLDALLAIEVDHYQITPPERKMFSSGDPEQAITAFVQIKQRFSHDPILFEDLDQRQLCWHFFRVLSDLSYSQGTAFRGLVGKQAVSSRNTLQMQVKEVITGIDALRLIPKIDYISVIYKDQQERIGQSTLMRKVSVREDFRYLDAAMLSTSIRMPPLAVRVSIEPTLPAIDMTTIQKRTFRFLAHADHPPQAMIDPIFGGMPKTDPRRLMTISNEVVDIKNLFNPEDFWVYFYGMPVPWRGDDETILSFEYTVSIGSARVVVDDSITVSTVVADNLTKPRTDAALTLDQLLQLRKSPLSKVKGHKLSTPVEAEVYISRSGDLVVHVLGFSDLKTHLLYSAKASGTVVRKAHAAGVELGLNWPSPTVRETLASAASESWVRFTGTVVHLDAGELYVIPDQVEPVR